MIQQLKFDPCASAHASEIVTSKGRKGLVTPLDGRLNKQICRNFFQSFPFILTIRSIVIQNLIIADFPLIIIVGLKCELTGDGPAKQDGALTP